MSGPNIELQCVSSKFLPADDCISFWREIGFPFTPTEMVTLEGWPWEGPRKLCPPALDMLEGFVKAGKIVFLYGKADGVNAGIEMEMERTKEGEPHFMTEFWANIGILPVMDYSSADGRPKEVEQFYSRVEQALTRFGSRGMLAAGIGVETYFEYHQTIEETMARSHVDRWLLPKNRD